MKYFLTGGRGFVGKNVKEYLTNKGHEVSAPTSEELNLLNPIEIKETFDIVVHCAISGGRRIPVDSPNIVYQNIAMFQHVWDFHKRCGSKLFFNIGSGAEQDRVRGVRNMEEPSGLPSDFYGLSKRTIHECFKNESDYINLRAYGVFGKYEEPQRFIRSAVENYKNGKNIIIHKEKRMDFFYVEDIAKIIEHISLHSDQQFLASYNLSYPDRKLFLGDLAKFINTLDNHEVGIHYESSSIDRDYFGSSKRLKTLDLELIGQKEAIRRMYEQLG